MRAGAYLYPCLLGLHKARLAPPHFPRGPVVAPLERAPLPLLAFHLHPGVALAAKFILLFLLYRFKNQPHGQPDLLFKPGSVIEISYLQKVSVGARQHRGAQKPDLIAGKRYRENIAARVFFLDGFTLKDSLNRRGDPRPGPLPARIPPYSAHVFSHKTSKKKRQAPVLAQGPVMIRIYRAVLAKKGHVSILADAQRFVNSHSLDVKFVFFKHRLLRRG